MYQEITNGRYTICHESGNVQYSFKPPHARAILEFLIENGKWIGAPKLPVKNLSQSHRDTLEEMRERENENLGEAELLEDPHDAAFQADYHRQRIEVLTDILGDREEWEVNSDA
jgi:RNA polymerase-binding transcription factor DksA